MKFNLWIYGPITITELGDSWGANIPGGTEFPAEMLPCGPALPPPHCWKWSMPGLPPKGSKNQNNLHQKQEM